MALLNAIQLLNELEAIRGCTEPQHYDLTKAGLKRCVVAWIGLYDKHTLIDANSNIHVLIKTIKGNTINWIVNIKTNKGRISNKETEIKRSIENRNGVYDSVINFEDFIKKYTKIIDTY